MHLIIVDKHYSLSILTRGIYAQKIGEVPFRKTPCVPESDPVQSTGKIGKGRFSQNSCVITKYCLSTLVTCVASRRGINRLSYFTNNREIVVATYKEREVEN